MSRKWTPWLLLAPMLVVMGVFLAGLASGILQGFGVIPAFGLDRPTLGYFHEVLADDKLLQSIGLSVYIAVVAACVTILLATLLSFALVSSGKTGGFAYALIKIPMFVPWMVTGLMMINLFSGGGWLARLFHTLGMEALAQAMSKVLYQPNHLGVILAFIWACTPFACFFIITVMGSLRDSLAEAARNLGANTWQSFWYVILPLCLPVIRDTFLIVLLSCFGSYEIPALLGMTTPRALPVEIYYQYNHFDLRHRPYAMALNTVMLILALLLAGISYALLRNNREKGKIHDDGEGGI
ncbi:MAG: ABC transporter permease subunit [Candidatus Pelethousia sp.]|nr:ABC transporter permease subunit [Candidatus Pelethousia sp.]